MGLAIASVDPLVPLQAGRGGKALPALSAAIRLFARMHFLMLFKVTPPDKALSALRAFVWLVVCMHFHVFPQSNGRREAFPALRTPMRFIARMHHLVRL